MGVVYTLCVDGIYYSILSVQMKNRIIGNMECCGRDGVGRIDLQITTRAGKVQRLIRHVQFL
jgi:hypothetical protein